MPKAIAKRFHWFPITVRLISISIRFVVRCQTKGRIDKVRQGYENGIYSLEEAKQRLAEYNKATAAAEDEKRRLQEKMARSCAQTDREAMKGALEALRDKNLDEAAFIHKADIIAKLGIKVYPSEDLRSMRVIALMNLPGASPSNNLTSSQSVTELKNKEHEPTVSCGKVTSGGAEGIRTPYLLVANEALSLLSYSPMIRGTAKL
jgi:hypothetical protein